MTTKIVTSTERGQITLPKQWRSHFSTDHYRMEMHEDRLVILPFDLESPADEEILFDAERDNDGKGVPLEDMIRMLKKLRHG